ncbi:MAG: hypothetical protein AAF193_07880, partial [Bacteroidota bacterium]
MNRLSLTVLVCMLSSLVFSQSIHWNLLIHEDSSIGISQTAIDSQGNIIARGEISSGEENLNPLYSNEPMTIEEGDSQYIAKYSAAGALEWVQFFQDEGTIAYSDLSVGNDGKIALSLSFRGSMTIPSAGGDVLIQRSEDIFNGVIILFDQEGNYLNHGVFSIDTYSSIRRVQFTDSNEIVVQGLYTNAVDLDLTEDNYILEDNEQRYFIAKYSNDLEFIWGYDLHHWNFGSMEFLSVAPDGRIAYGGGFSSTWDSDFTDNEDLWEADVIDGFIHVLDSDGQLLWSKQFSGVNWEYVGDAAFSEDGDLYIVGRHLNQLLYTSELGTQNIIGNGEFIIKFNSDYEVLWQDFTYGETIGSKTLLELDEENEVVYTFARGWSDAVLPNSEIVVGGEGEQLVFVKWTLDGDIETAWNIFTSNYVKLKDAHVNP